jgi:hypothetical protein
MKYIIAIIIPILLIGCGTDAQVASRNLSKAADMFEIERRIVFYNGITEGYMLVIEGRCSIAPDRAGKKLDVTCRTGSNEFKKHFLGLSDNVTYFVEQIGSSEQSAYHYRVIFKPQTLIPIIDFRSSVTD